MSSEIKANKISPATGTAFTLGDSGDTFTVPSGTTLDIASGATLDTTGATVSGLTTGKVLQVVQAVKTDTFTTTSGTLVDVTGLSVAITPSSTSSKILVFANVWASANYYAGHIGLFRDSTELGLADAASNRPRSLMDFVGDNTVMATHGQILCLSAHYLDSPSSTSALTYKIKAARRYDNSSSPVTYINRSAPDRDTNTYDHRKSSVITAMEIGA
jgi:hypothetical protein